MFCTNCGVQNEDGSKFCTACGAILEAEQSTESAQEGNNVLPETAETQKKEFKNGKKIIISAIIIIAIVAVLAFASIGIFGTDEMDISQYPIIYTSDDDIKVLPHGEDEAYELGDGISYYDIDFSKDGKYIYFIENGRLYYRDADDDDARKEKLASHVFDFTILGDTKNVIYLTDDNDLYFHNLKEKYKLAKNVANYSLDKNCKNIKYTTDDNKLYLRGLGEDDKPTKIDSDVGSTIYYDTVTNEICYMKNDDIYVYNGKKSQKIGRGFVSAKSVGERLYAVKETSKTYGFEELVIDDISDSLGIEPYMHLKRPHESEYDSYSEYSDKYDYWYDVLWDEYYELDEEIRDGFDTYDEIMELKAELEEEPIEISSYDLYLYEGDEFKKIDSGLTESEPDVMYGEKPEDSIMYYSKAKGGKISKVKLSDYADSLYSLKYDIEEEITSDPLEKETVFFKNGKKMAGIDNDVVNFIGVISGDGKTLYALIYDDLEDDFADLVRYKVGSDKFTDAKVIFKDISTFTIYDDNDILARNEDEELVGIINGKEVNLGDDVYDYEYFEGDIYYIEDYNSDKNSGELIRYNGGKNVTICDDVYYQLAVFAENKIVYIRNYDYSDGGELCISNKNGKAKVIDDEVTDFKKYY